MNTAGGADDDVGAARLELLDVILDDGTANAGLNLHVHVLADGVHDVSDLHGQFARGGHNESLAVVGDAALRVRVNALQHTNGEGAGFTGTRLGLHKTGLTHKFLRD